MNVGLIKGYLQFLSQIDPLPENVSSSLLQGDPWSMLGMTIFLLPAAEDIARHHPTVTQALYADDRSVATSAACELIHVVGRWQRWGALLGLAENTEKSQYYHPTTAGRRNLAEAGVPEEQIVADLKVLGYCFHSVNGRQANPTENKRLQKAQALAQRVRCLPGTLQRRIRIAQYVVPAKAGYGWLCRNPSLQDVKPLDTAVRRLQKKQEQANPDLYRLIRGHFWDLRFLATQSQVSTLVRFAHRFQTALPVNLLSKAGWPRTLTQGLARLGWVKTRQWTWRHAAIGASFSVSGRLACRKSVKEVTHLLRESWRRTKVSLFLQSGRRDAAILQNFRYEEKRFTALRRMCLDQHTVAVVTGAFISPACYDRMRGSPDHSSLCPWCLDPNILATHDHVCWNCNHAPEHVRFEQCFDTAQARLAWPACRDSQVDSDVLRWLAQCRQACLSLRN